MSAAIERAARAALLAPLAWPVLALLTAASLAPIACAGVTEEQHAANAAEAAGYAAELADCRRQGREAKKDGGAEAYIATYEKCASDADARHGVTFSTDGGR